MSVINKCTYGNGCGLVIAMPIGNCFHCLNYLDTNLACGLHGKCSLGKTLAKFHQNWSKLLPYSSALRMLVLGHILGGGGGVYREYLCKVTL